MVESLIAWIVQNPGQTIAYSISIALSIASFGTTLYVKHFTAKMESANNKDLESFKHALDREAHKVDVVLANQGVGQEVLYKERVNAVKHIWGMALNMRKLISSPIGLTRVLSPEEYRFVNTDSRAKGFVSNFNGDKLLSDLLEMDIETIRPFISDELYVHAFEYRAFVGRILFVLKTALEKNEELDWFSDNGIKQIIGSSFTEQERKGISGGSPLGSLAKYSDAYQQRLLDAARALLSGEYAVMEADEMLKRLFIADKTVISK